VEVGAVVAGAAAAEEVLADRPEPRVGGLTLEVQDLLERLLGRHRRRTADAEAHACADVGLTAMGVHRRLDVGALLVAVVPVRYGAYGAEPLAAHEGVVRAERAHGSGRCQLEGDQLLVVVPVLAVLVGRRSDLGQHGEIGSRGGWA